QNKKTATISQPQTSAIYLCHFSIHLKERRCMAKNYNKGSEDLYRPSLHDEFDTWDWYDPGSKTEIVRAGSARAAFALSGIRKTLFEGQDVNFISPDFRVTIKGRKSRLKKEDVQVFIESDLIPYTQEGAKGD